MSIIFSYSGTSPATVVTFDINMGDISCRPSWMSPEIKAAGGENSFIYDKDIAKAYHFINVRQMTAATYALLLAFLEAVDGISNPWDYTDPYGVAWTARFWNANEINSSMIRHAREEIEIILLLTSPS